MVSSMPPNGHSTANSKVSAGGSGHSHSPNPLKPSSRPCMPLLPGDQDTSGPDGGSPGGGRDAGGCPGNRRGAGSPPAGTGSKNMPPRYAARQQTAQM